ncbi:hypothetical protein CBL_10728 [Carabus blaptoides fortunei]
MGIRKKLQITYESTRPSVELARLSEQKSVQLTSPDKSFNKYFSSELPPGSNRVGLFIDFSPSITITAINKLPYTKHTLYPRCRTRSFIFVYHRSFRHPLSVSLIPDTGTISADVLYWNQGQPAITKRSRLMVPHHPFSQALACSRTGNGRMFNSEIRRYAYSVVEGQELFGYVMFSRRRSSRRLREKGYCADNIIKSWGEPK